MDIDFGGFMVKHIILWTLKDMSQEEKERVKAGTQSRFFMCGFTV